MTDTKRVKVVAYCRYSTVEQAYGENLERATPFVKSLCRYSRKFFASAEVEERKAYYEKAHKLFERIFANKSCAALIIAEEFAALQAQTNVRQSCNKAAVWPNKGEWFATVDVLKSLIDEQNAAK